MKFGLRHSLSRGSSQVVEGGALKTHYIGNGRGSNPLSPKY
jgi:hypothetical protein